MGWGTWWAWVVGAGVFGLLELIVPTYILLGFSIGALAVAAGLWLGWLGGSLPLLLVVFAIASLAAWIVLRTALGVRKGQVKRWDTDIND
ncbi:hypothetical protein ILP92_07470 [Maribius pontilimi]|uniref:NfeD-like C-terminal, partner-binding n=1 Tax=Palleronia pontilimi TaxID=1964209 RepID=A0A934IFN4_9RHOB|nr:hypothetical protein [Palleronia pontilimi]MBJ3762580.1 hypothetical protein [Palleronia pontilimi]